MKRIPLGIAMALFVSGCESLSDATSKAAEGFQSTLQSAHDSVNGAQGTNSVRGRVRLKDGQTLTCFNGIPAGYLGSPTMSSPGEGSYDPKTGRATLKTAAIPAVVMTESGTVIQNNCDKLASEGVLVAETGGGSGDRGAADGLRPQNSQPLSKTELVNFFEKHPQPGAGKWITWPRVVITLVEAPSWGQDKLSQFNHFRPPAFGCWRFKAKIWESEKVSREIPAFHRCTDDSLKVPGGDNHAYYEIWSGLVTPSEKKGSTGISRTDGPNFPDTPLPVAKRSNQAKLNPVTFTGQTIEGVLYATGLDMTKPDPRLWLNFSAQAEAN